MQEPIWNDLSSEHKKIHNKAMKESNGYCIECQKPVTFKHYLCNVCIRNLKLTGLEQTRVGYKQVGLETINYQQYLHRAYFKCNAPYEYRGIYEDRLRTSITQEHINTATNILHNSLLNLPDCQLKTLYIKIQDMRNCQRRLLYGITLYGLAYYILESKSFKHKTHYQASIVKQLENDIKRMYIRTHINNIDPKHDIESAKHRTLLLSKQLYNIISKTLNGVIPNLL